MSTSINQNVSFNQDIRTLAKSADKKENSTVGSQSAEFYNENKTIAAIEPIAISEKKQRNAAIIESSLTYSNSVADEPLSLILKTALQGINEALAESGITTSVEDAYESGMDFSPEASADRIVTFSTQFFDAYKEDYPEMDEEQALTTFVDIISGGIEQGFAEAKDILEGLKVLDGEIATNIEKTYDLVRDGLQAFVDSFANIEV